MIYKEPPRIDHTEALRIFQEGDPIHVAEALLGLSLYDEDVIFIQSWCLFFLNSINDTIASAAATSIGHLARIRQCINKNVVVPALEITRSRQKIQGTIEDALDDIKTYCPDQ